MSPRRSKILITAGIFTLIQTMTQGLFSLLCLCEIYCLLNFLRSYPPLVYLRILYFNNPNVCQDRIVIGNDIPELPNSAFVLIPHLPFTVTRTFIICCCSLSLCILWLFSSLLIMASPRRGVYRLPWVGTTIAMCILDLSACVAYSNDTYHTKTLNDLLDYIGANASGLGNVVIDTSWATRIMLILHSRFILFFALNVILLILVLVDNTQYYYDEEQASEYRGRTTTFRNINELKPKYTPRLILPRVSEPFGIHPTPLPEEVRRKNVLSRLGPLPTNIDKKQTVSFPENLMSIPQRLENLMAEQYRRFNQDIDLFSPVSTSLSMPQLAGTNDELSKTSEELRDSIAGRGRRRSTLVELQSQMPWSYQPSPYRVRDQLPANEERPPVPLADYTAPNARKASVHRAGSSLSMLARQREEPRQPRRKWSSFPSDE